MTTCSIPGCNKKHEARGWCEMHYARWKRYGDPLKLVIAERGGAVNADGYRKFARKLAHIAVAEKAFGGPLPKGAVVHHVNYNKTDNRPTNLVVCSRGYHKVIHQRTDAYNACGNPNWRKCYYCKQYDDPANLYLCKTSAYHNKCRREKHAERRAGA